jgi:DNA-binding transcriptional MerR regulator
VDVSVVDVIQDLNALRDLAEREDDPERRRALRSVRSRVADRDRGAKVAEAADVLSVSPTTVRAWIKTGVLQSVPRSSPIRVEVLNLADVKRVVDLLRAHGQDRDLLSAIYRRLRDHDLLETDEFAEGFEDLRAGRVMPIGDDLRKETAELDRAE